MLAYACHPSYSILFFLNWIRAIGLHKHHCSLLDINISSTFLILIFTFNNFFYFIVPFMVFVIVVFGSFEI
jgi:uncharacterized membrane protein